MKTFKAAFEVLVFVVVFGYLVWFWYQHKNIDIAHGIEIQKRDSIIAALQTKVEDLGRERVRVDTLIKTQDGKIKKIVETREVVINSLRYIPADSLMLVFQKQLEQAGK